MTSSKENRIKWSLAIEGGGPWILAGIEDIGVVARIKLDYDMFYSKNNAGIEIFVIHSNDTLYKKWFTAKNIQEAKMIVELFIDDHYKV